MLKASGVELDFDCDLTRIACMLTQLEYTRAVSWKLLLVACPQATVLISETSMLGGFCNTLQLCVPVQVPIGAGLALSHKMKGDGNIAFALYGDGAANQGQIAEAMNTSALWDVPVIFVCENNHYGMGTSEWRGSKSPTFYKRGDYVPGIRVDGMDVLAMKQATVWARQFVLENGPLCFEADTYRHVANLFHSCASAAHTYGGASCYEAQNN